MGFRLQDLRIMKAYFYGSEHEFVGLFHEVILPFAQKYMKKDYAIIKKRRPVPHYQILYDYDEKMEGVSRAYILEDAIEAFCEERHIHYSEDALRSNMFLMQIKDESRMKVQVDAQIRYDIYVNRHKKVVCNYACDVYQRDLPSGEDIIKFAEILFGAQDKLSRFLTEKNPIAQSELAFCYHLITDVSHTLCISFESMMDIIKDRMMELFKEYDSKSAEEYMKRFERWYGQFTWAMTEVDYEGRPHLCERAIDASRTLEREQNILARCIEIWMENLGIYGVRIHYCCYAALRYTNEWNELKDRTVLL